ncbi:MAG: amidohydrolase family protein [Bacillota bacterium]
MAGLAVLGRILDGTGSEPLAGVVLIDGGIISHVGPRETPPPPGYRVIDAGDRTVMPGLIDAHVHLIGTRSLNLAQWAHDPVAVRAARVVADCASLINAGFTTVRDAGGMGHLIKRVILEGEIRGPRILSAALSLSQTGGHGDLRTLPLEQSRQLGFLSRICDGEDDCRKAAREQLREGADFLKVMATGGVLGSAADTPKHAEFSTGELLAIVEEAERVGTHVAAHAHAAAGVNTALKAGIRTIEHGTLMDDESIELFLMKGAFLVPTLSILHRMLLPEFAASTPAWAVVKARQILDTHHANIMKAKKAGVRVIVGTDFAGGPQVPHGSNALELELLVGLGFSPLEAIQAATRVAADAIQLGDRLGTLEPGKYADLIVVDGDPLVDVTCLQEASNIKLVLKNGEVEKSLL